MPTPRLSVTPLEDRTAPAVLTGLAGALLNTGLTARATTAAAAWADVPLGNTGVRLGDAMFAAGSDVGAPPQASLLGPDGAVRFRVTPFEQSFTGGVRVAVGDVNGDGAPDLIVGAGPGRTSLVQVFSGTDASLLTQFAPFEGSYTGGVFVVATDINGDGRAEVVVTADQGGGPRVRVLSGDGQTVFADVLGIDDPNFRGGARATVGDVNGDGVPDVVVAAGFGGGPRVAVFNGVTVLRQQPTRLVPDFFAFENTLRNGTFVAVGDLNRDGFGDLVFGAGPGGAPRVRAASGQGILVTQIGSLDDATAVGVPLANFFAGDSASRGGVRVAVAPTLTGFLLAGFPAVLAATADGGPAQQYGLAGVPLASFAPFTTQVGGLFVGSAQNAAGPIVPASLRASLGLV
ncbi:MAG: VCBS repeat-containing protein [Gemmataceae bacterium]